MQKRKVKGPKMTSLEERLRIAREVNAYREAHPEMNVDQVLQAMGNPCSVHNYFAWNKRLELAEATRKANASAADGVETANFPLEVIPAKAPKAEKKIKAAAPVEEDATQVMAALLENLAKLLRRQ